MKPLQPIIGLVVGAALILSAIMNVAEVIQVGTNPEMLLTAFGWELAAMVGVYIFGWGAFEYLSEGGSGSERPTPPSGKTGVPSANSKVRR